MKIIKFGFIILAIAIFIAACNPAKPANNAVPANSNAAKATTSEAPADNLASGRKLYAENCAICHKDTGEGGKITVEGKAIDPISLVSDKAKNRSDEKLTGQISEGSPEDGMPAFKTKLSEAQIKDIENYIRHGLQKM